MVDVIDAFASKMNIELQGKNIEEFSTDIGYGMNDRKNADFIYVEKFACVKICFNGGMDEKSVDIFGGRMVDVVDEFASEMNVELQAENIDKFSADIGYGMNDRKNGDFTYVEQFSWVKKSFNSRMNKKVLIFLVVEWWMLLVHLQVR